MNQQQTYWDIAVYIAPLVFLILALPTLYLAWRTHRKGLRFAAHLKSGQPSYMSRETFLNETPVSYQWSAAAIVAGVALIAGIIAAQFYPWEARFWQWRSVTGQVQTIESRFTGGDSGTSQQYVAVIDGVERQLTDPRAALLKPGDEVSLMCKQVWQYGAASINVCRWGGEVVNR